VTRGIVAGGHSGAGSSACPSRTFPRRVQQSRADKDSPGHQQNQNNSTNNQQNTNNSNIF
jgi:hypothetical protein